MRAPGGRAQLRAFRGPKSSEKKRRGKEEVHERETRRKGPLTLLLAISDTDRCVCIVSSWSRHQSSSSGNREKLE